MCEVFEIGRLLVGEKRDGVRGKGPQCVRGGGVYEVAVFGNVRQAVVELRDGVEGRGEGGEGG